MEFAKQKQRCKNRYVSIVQGLPDFYVLGVKMLSRRDVVYSALAFIT